MSFTFVKYCPLCGAENSRLQPFCAQCDGDLSMVGAELQREAGAAPPPAEAETRTRRVEAAADGCVLELVADPAVRFTVQDGQTMGRTDAANIMLEGKVPDWQYISSCHARFLKRGAQWYVMHVGGTNFNIVDGTKYTGDDEVAIYDNSTLTLSKTPFRVRIGRTDGTDG